MICTPNFRKGIIIIKIINLIYFHFSPRLCKVSVTMPSPGCRLSLSVFCRVLNFH